METKVDPAEKFSKKKITIEVDEDDPCLRKDNEIEKEEESKFKYSPSSDPRYTCLRYS